MIKTALIILTVSSTGQTHMAMTETDSFDDCRDAAEVVGGILTEAEVKIAAMRCGQTDLQLTEYAHGYTEEEMRWHYRVEIKGTALEDGFLIQSIAPGTCNGEDEGTYCTISAQHPLGQ
jgi:hypothetical protein